MTFTQDQKELIRDAILTQLHQDVNSYAADDDMSGWIDIQLSYQKILKKIGYDIKIGSWPDGGTLIKEN